MAATTTTTTSDELDNTKPRIKIVIKVLKAFLLNYAPIFWDKFYTHYSDMDSVKEYIEMKFEDKHVFTTAQYDSLVLSASNPARAKTVLGTICQNSIRHCVHQLASRADCTQSDFKSALELLGECVKGYIVNGKVYRVLKITSIKCLNIILQEGIIPTISVIELAALLVASYRYHCFDAAVQQEAHESAGMDRRMYHGHSLKRESDILDSLELRANYCDKLLPVGSLIYTQVPSQNFLISLPMVITKHENLHWDKQIRDPSRCFITNSKPKKALVMDDGIFYYETEPEKPDPCDPVQYVLVATSKTKERLCVLEKSFWKILGELKNNKNYQNSLWEMLRTYNEADNQKEQKEQKMDDFNDGVIKLIRFLERKYKTNNIPTDTPENIAIHRNRDLVSTNYNRILSYGDCYYDFDIAKAITKKEFKIPFNFGNQIIFTGANASRKKISAKINICSWRETENVDNNQTFSLSANSFAKSIDTVVESTKLPVSIAKTIVIKALGLEYYWWEDLQDQCMCF